MSSHLSIINRAGRQRMLTQKLMKLFFIRCYKVPYPGKVDEEIMEIIETFNETHIMLMGCPENTEEVRKSISTVQSAWMNFILSINSMNVDHVVELNSIVLVQMDKLVTQLVDQYSLEEDVLTAM
ncbi:MAG: hypothetical protein NE328_14600 [Lentisphaeraceae bacterium]|nr:hypothetical protein [Lentisphaeraceae bacterium]